MASQTTGLSKSRSERGVIKNMGKVTGFSAKGTDNGFRLRVLARLNGMKKNISKAAKTTKEISAAVRKNPSSVRWALFDMRKAGLVHITDGKSVFGTNLYSITENGVLLLEEIRSQCVGGIRDWSRIELDRWPW